MLTLSPQSVTFFDSPIGYAVLRLNWTSPSNMFMVHSIRRPPLRCGLKS